MNNINDNEISFERKETMFCRKCGKEIENSSNFCSSCGTNISAQIPTIDNNVLTDKVRLSLKNFDAHLELICLECGYQGLAGVVKSQMRYPFLKKFWLYWIISWIFALIIVVTSVQGDPTSNSGIMSILFILKILFFPLLNFLGIAMFFISLFLFFQRQHIVHCPNCEQDVVIK